MFLNEKLLISINFRRNRRFYQKSAIFTYFRAKMAEYCQIYQTLLQHLIFLF